MPNLTKMDSHKKNKSMGITWSIVLILVFLCMVNLLNTKNFKFITFPLKLFEINDFDYFNETKSLHNEIIPYRTVISMATLPARLPSMLGNVLPSLLEQKKYAPLDAIWIHVALNWGQQSAIFPSTRQYILNHYQECSSSVKHQSIVLSCSKDPSLYFVFPSKNQRDLGPATKLLGTLPFEKDPSTRIVTVDDDMIYDSRMLYTLLLHEPKNFQSALGFSCEIQPPTDNTSYWITISGGNGWWKHPFNDVVDCKGWLHGYQGILYKRGFFQDFDAYNTSLMPSGCFYHDDVRLAGYLAMKGIRRSVYPHFTFFFMDRFTHLSKNKSNALSLIPQTMLRHQWPCVKYFEKFW